MVLPQNLLQGRVLRGLRHAHNRDLEMGVTVSSGLTGSSGPPRTGGLSALGEPASFLLLLSMGSQEPWTELVGALPTHRPSWWMTGLVVHRLRTCSLEVPQSPSKDTTIPRGHRAPSAGFGCLVARSGCQETAWRLRPFPGLVLPSTHPAVWTTQLTERAH